MSTDRIDNDGGHWCGTFIGYAVFCAVSSAASTPAAPTIAAKIRPKTVCATVIAQTS
jgi:hypothetical protein